MKTYKNQLVFATFCVFARITTKPKAQAATRAGAKVFAVIFNFGDYVATRSEVQKLNRLSNPKRPLNNISITQNRF